MLITIVLFSLITEVIGFLGMILILWFVLFNYWYIIFGYLFFLVTICSNIMSIH